MSTLEAVLQTLTEIEMALRVAKEQIALAILQQGTEQEDKHGVTAGSVPKPLRKVEWAAEILDVSVQRVYDLARRKVIPSVQIGERRVRFDEGAIYDWIRAGGTTKLSKI